MTTCLNDKCGREIVKDQFCVESGAQFEKRTRGGYCRPKCKRLSAPVKQERTTSTLELVSANYDRAELVAQIKEVPVVDEKYRSFVRDLPCLVPGCNFASEFHHQNMKAHGGKGALCSDYRGLPLCRWHHTLGGFEGKPGSYHGSAKLTGWRFWSVYGIDVEATIHRLNAMWLEMGHKFK